jgi:uncharacterized LabA/DUF88 family protein
LLPVRHAERPRAGLSFTATDNQRAAAIEPAIKRAITFIDGQNLFHHAKDSFGFGFPNYDILKLSEAVCASRNWILSQARFYTGIPDPTDNPKWNQFWTAKLAHMGRQGVHVFSRALRYRNKTIRIPGAGEYTFLSGEEKGIDVRIALDVIGLANRGAYDVAVIFSQDQDLSEVADEIRQISKRESRWIKLACSYPLSPTSQNRRGINNTDWVPIDRTMYNSCIDTRDYRRGANAF